MAKLQRLQNVGKSINLKARRLQKSILILNVKKQENQLNGAFPVGKQLLRRGRVYKVMRVGGFP